MSTKLAGFDMNVHPYSRNIAPNEARDATVEKEAVLNSRYVTYEPEKRRHRNERDRNRLSIGGL